VAVDLVHVGATLRAIRVARRERLEDVARRSGLSASVIGRIERGVAAQTPVGSYSRLAAALGATTQLWVRWQGADLDRLTNAAHGALHECVARLLKGLPEWQVLPEVTFSIYGERGVIDWLIWHPATRSLLVIEIKSALVDVNALLAQIDRYVRLAGRIAAERGWDAATVSVWVVFADGPRNRRALAAHATVLRGVLPHDGRTLAAWLRHPTGSIRALSFLSNCRGATGRPKRVRRPASRSAPPRTNPASGASRATVPPT
jgi:transcriptional regulator with XRE-family HTH domain